MKYVQLNAAENRVFNAIAEGQHLACSVHDAIQDELFSLRLSFRQCREVLRSRIWQIMQTGTLALRRAG